MRSPGTGMHARWRGRASTSRARAAAAASTRQVVLGHQPVSQQNKTEGSRTPAPRAQMGSLPAADTRTDVRQQKREVRGAGAALPRCLGPRSADLQRPCRVGSKSGREGRRDAAAQHTHYGAVHKDAGQTRAMRASSGPDLDAPLRVAAQRNINSYGQQHADNQNISFLPAIVSTSTRMHGEFLRLLFLQAHRETEAHFTAAGIPRSVGHG
jgi:hypothetical protein